MSFFLSRLLSSKDTFQNPKLCLWGLGFGMLLLFLSLSLDLCRFFCVFPRIYYKDATKEDENNNTTTTIVTRI